MPLFANKFNPSKTTPRKSLTFSTVHRALRPKEIEQEFGDNISNAIHLRLGDVEGVFEDGQWVVEEKNNLQVSKLKKQNQELKNENNLLKLKVEILLDMLAETTIESHMQAKEIEELKSSAEPKQTSKRLSFNT